MVFSASVSLSRKEVGKKRFIELLSSQYISKPRDWCRCWDNGICVPRDGVSPMVYWCTAVLYPTWKLHAACRPSHLFRLSSFLPTLLTFHIRLSSPFLAAFLFLWNLHSLPFPRLHLLPLPHHSGPFLTSPLTWEPRKFVHVQCCFIGEYICPLIFISSRHLSLLSLLVKDKWWEMLPSHVSDWWADPTLKNQALCRWRTGRSEPAGGW